MCKPTTVSSVQKDQLRTGRLEATVVAVLTIISSVVYTVKLFKWSEENIDSYVNQSQIVEEQEKIRHLCKIVVLFSLTGNALAFLSSIPVFYATWAPTVAECRLRRHAVLPYIFVHIFLFVTAINKLALAYLFFGESDKDMFSYRGLDVVTDGLALFLMVVYFMNLQRKPKALCQADPLADQEAYVGDSNTKDAMLVTCKQGYSKLKEEPIYVDDTPVPVV